MIHYEFTRYLQPTNHSCAQAAFAMLLSYYDEQLTPDNVLSEVEANKDEQGNDIGSIIQDLARFCVKRGHKTTIHSADFQLLDTTWSALTQKEIRARLDQVRAVRNVPALGDFWVKQYLKSYAKFMDAGGYVKVVQYFSEEYFDELLQHGPFLPTVAPAVLYGDGHTRTEDSEVRQAVSDDINGDVGTHSVVVYGKSEVGEYLVADPWYGDKIVTPQALAAACAGAQIECDNLIVTIEKKQGEGSTR